MRTSRPASRRAAIVTLVAAMVLGFVGSVSAVPADTTIPSARTAAMAAEFSDVPFEHAFWMDIHWVASRGLATGYADGTFRGGAAISRQALAAMLFRVENPGAVKPTCDVAPFSDVPARSEFCGEIRWMRDNSYATGTNGAFLPAAPASRQAVAAFLTRIWGPAILPTCTTAPYPDVPVNHPFCREISWLAAERVIRGYQDGTFKGGNPTTRQAFASFLFRHYQPNRRVLSFSEARNNDGIAPLAAPGNIEPSSARTSFRAEDFTFPGNTWTPDGSPVAFHMPAPGLVHDNIVASGQSVSLPSGPKAGSRLEVLVTSTCADTIGGTLALSVNYTNNDAQQAPLPQIPVWSAAPTDATLASYSLQAGFLDEDMRPYLISIHRAVTAGWYHRNGTLSNDTPHRLYRISIPLISDQPVGGLTLPYTGYTPQSECGTQAVLHVFSVAVR